MNVRYGWTVSDERICKRKESKVTVLRIEPFNDCSVLKETKSARYQGIIFSKRNLKSIESLAEASQRTSLCFKTAVTYVGQERTQEER